MRTIKNLWGIILVAILVAGITGEAYAQTPIGSQYFPESNHTVSGEFLAFYRSLAEPYLVLGYPITEAAEDPVTHYQVQYFLYGRLELHPEAPGGQRVSLSNLGELIYTPGSPLADVPDDGPTCRLFPATGKSVCYAFLQFYDAHNGPAYFGAPISKVEVQDGRYVQYFEKTRMEWRPEMPAGQRVALMNMGWYYYNLIQGRGPSGSAIGPARPVSLKVRAFVSRSLIPVNNQQTLYIIVQDQALKPVSQAVTGVMVTLPDGKQEYYRPPVTDANGISILTFKVEQGDPKQVVQVEVVATTGDLEQHTTTWFRIWW